MMPVDGLAVGNTIAQSSLVVAANISIILLAGMYFIFSLIVVRQIKLMTETVIADDAPFLRAFGILHSGVALGIIILLIGFLFG